VNPTAASVQRLLTILPVYEFSLTNDLQKAILMEIFREKFSGSQKMKWREFRKMPFFTRKTAIFLL